MNSGKIIKAGNLLLLGIVLILSAPFTASAQNMEKTLERGITLTGTLKPGGEHTYRIEAGNDMFIFGYVLQQSVDVKLEITGPDGSTLATFDQPARGREYYQFTTSAAGIYHLKVSPFEEGEGEYSVTLRTVEAVPDDPGEQVKQLLSKYNYAQGPGAAVMVVQDDEIIYTGYFGMANLTFGIPFNENTRHNIGSTSKHFANFALLLLQEDGKLSLDDDVRKHIPELPDFGHTVTIRHLSTHTSGYREFLNTLAMTGRPLGADLSREKIIEIVQRQPELQNIPGAEWNYNNTGYALIAEIIKRTSGMSFPEYMKQRVFSPLEMYSTVVRGSQAHVVESRSAGYYQSEEGEYLEATDLGGAMGAGGIHSTMEDLSRWVANFSDPQLGTPAMIDSMVTPYTLNNGAPTGYGLGLFIQEYKGLKYIQHGGADVAHRSMLAWYPDINAAVITQSNDASFNAAGISAQVTDIFFQDHLNDEENAAEETDSSEEAEFAYRAENFDQLAGRYELSVMPGFVLTFSREGDQLFTQGTGQPQVALNATSDSTFSLVGVNAALTFHMKEDGSADSLTLHQNGNHIAHKIEWNPSDEELAGFSGVYFSEELQTRYKVVVSEEGKLQLEHYQLNDPIELEAGVKDEFSGGFPISNIKFVRGEAGEIIGFTAGNGRTRDVHFTKLTE